MIPSVMPISTTRRDALIRRPTPFADQVVIEIGDKTARAQLEKGQRHPAKDLFPYHRLCHIRPADSDPQAVELIYAADRERQDEYNWEAADSSLSGDRFQRVQRSYIIARSAFSSSSPAQGSAMPDTPGTLFEAGFVLAARQQQRLDESLDSLYVGESRTYVQRSTIVSSRFDELTSKNLSTAVDHYFRGELIDGTPVEDLFADSTNSFWGLQADGTFKEGAQNSTDWFTISSRQVVGGELVGGKIVVESFYTNVNYYWPPVLAFLTTRSWERLDGSFRMYPSYEMKPEAYRGPCKALYTQTWSVTQHVIPEVQQMLPRALSYSSPGFSVTIPACLHGFVELRCDYGTADPVWDYNVTSQQVYGATNHTEWPPSVIAEDSQKKFRGGYLRTTITVFQPDTDA